MWPRAFLQAVQPLQQDEDQLKLLRELEALESVQDQVAQPLSKAMAEAGYQPKVKAGARGLNKAPHLPAFLKAQANPKLSLDTVSPVLWQDFRMPELYKANRAHRPSPVVYPGRSAFSSQDFPTTSESGSLKKRGYRPNSAIG